MIVKIHTRGEAETLHRYLLTPSDNESVLAKRITLYPYTHIDARDIGRAFRHMEAHAATRHLKRYLYHVILSLAAGERMRDDQLDVAMAAVARAYEVGGHQMVVVEHRKGGRQHFHLVVSRLHPLTHRLRTMHPFRKSRTAGDLNRELSDLFGFQPVAYSRMTPRKWELVEHQGSPRYARRLRSDITTMYETTTTAREFVARLADRGVHLTRGRFGCLVVVDGRGDIRVLTSCIEGVTLADIKAKHPDLYEMSFPPLRSVLATVRHNPSSRDLGRSERALTPRVDARASSDLCVVQRPPRVSPQLSDGTMPRRPAPYVTRRALDLKPRV